MVIVMTGIHFLASVLLAHLSKMLIGELTVNRRPFTISNIFSETAWPAKTKFCVKTPWVGGIFVRSRHLGHMTKMAATPRYGKTLQIPRNVACSIGDSSPIQNDLKKNLVGRISQKGFELEA